MHVMAHMHIIIKKIAKKKQGNGAGEMPQNYRKLTTLAEDLSDGSIPILGELQPHCLLKVPELICKYPHIDIIYT